MKKYFNITNSLATIALICGLALFFLLLVFELKKEYSNTVPWTFLGASLVLYIWPEKLISAGGKVIDRKGDTL